MKTTNEKFGTYYASLILNLILMKPQGFYKMCGIVHFIC